MLRCRMRTLFVVGLCAIATGCSLDAGGTADNGLDGSAGDSSVAIDSEPHDGIFVVDDTATPTEDGTPPPDSTPPPDTAPPLDTAPPCDESTCGALPAGAKRVALVDRSVACPAGFDSTDIVEETGGNGCGCSCSVTGAPICPGAGAVSSSRGDVACDTTGPTFYSVGSSVCSGFGTMYSMPTYYSMRPPAAIGGSCGAAPTMDSAAVSRPRRICEPRAGTCASPICASPFVECIEIAGSCPSAFPNARRIGSIATVTCPACTCTMSAVGCTGTLTLYDADCAGTRVASLRADGSCVLAPTGSIGTTYSHFKYAPNPAPAATCSPSYSTAPGTRTVAGERNLCCR